MFTGLIQDIGTVRTIDRQGDWKITIETALDMKAVEIGASIACSGVCLTVVEKTENSFSVQVSQETISKTIIAAWHEGTRVNLEPSLKLGQELGGHFVFGHVDGFASILKIDPQGDSYVLTIRLPEEFAKFVAPKGSISIDGISLTVNDVDKDTFTVNIIPHTWVNTTLSFKKQSDSVHIEIDMLARYVSRMLTQEAA